MMDIPAMHRVRMSVRENRLVSTVLTETDYATELEAGAGWVVEDGERVVGFAMANAATGNLWALFVEPQFEGRGYGKQLHDELIGWMSSQPVDRWWLTTEAGTRAERFYVRAGWTPAGPTGTGEVRFERTFSSRR